MHTHTHTHSLRASLLRLRLDVDVDVWNLWTRGERALAAPVIRCARGESGVACAENVEDDCFSRAAADSSAAVSTKM